MLRSLFVALLATAVLGATERRFTVGIPASARSPAHTQIVLEEVQLPAGEPVRLIVVADSDSVALAEAAIPGISSARSGTQRLPRLRLPLSRAGKAQIESRRDSLTIWIRALDAHRKPLATSRWAVKRVRIEGPPR